MQSFVDEARITVSSGNGGHGAVSFRREKYVPNGGPDGGDGGRGGDVIFLVKSNLKTLYHLKTKHSFKARNGEPGKGKRMHGSDGEPVVIAVPPGTLVSDKNTGEVYRDFSTENDGETWLFLNGGSGGKGNWHFRSSKMQSPRYSHPGSTGETAELVLELKLIADIGLIGFPNAGKSTLLKSLTNANPKIAPYPFTTKIPNLGVFRFFDSDIVIADIPGIIRGASKGAGLGFKFLKHIARTSCLVFLIDLSDEDYEQAFPVLLDEITGYSPELKNRKRIIVGTKTDTENSKTRLEHLRALFSGEKILGISAISGEGLDILKKEFIELIPK